MNIDLSKPSNNYWAILVSALLYPVLVLVSFKFYPVCSGGLECLGTGMIEFAISVTLVLAVTCFGIYPLMNKLFKVQPELKPIKPLSLFLGVILGIGSLVFILFTLGKFIPDLVYTSKVMSGIYVFVYFLTILGIPALWIKMIDKIINR